MNNLSRMIKGRIKEISWVWRPILLFSIIAFVVYILYSDSAYTTSQINVIRQKEPITKVELKIVSDAGVKNVTLTDAKQLDSIDRALKFAKEVNVQRGGAHETWAEVNLFKGDRTITFRILHSVFNGWMIVVGGKTLSHEYLFELVKRYAIK